MTTLQARSLSPPDKVKRTYLKNGRDETQHGHVAQASTVAIIVHWSDGEFSETRYYFDETPDFHELQRNDLA